MTATLLLDKFWTCMSKILLLLEFRLYFFILRFRWSLQTEGGIYYVDASVLLENNRWHIFHILTSEDIDDVIYRFLH